LAAIGKFNYWALPGNNPSDARGLYWQAVRNRILFAICISRCFERLCPKLSEYHMQKRNWKSVDWGWFPSIPKYCTTSL